MLLYYITDRRQFGGTRDEQRRSLLAKINQAACAGVDYIQLREKDLHPGELEQLARETVALVAGRAQVLINARSDVAIASCAHGVHLTSNDISAGDVRSLWTHALPQPAPVIGVSCHSVAEVHMAASQGATFAVFAPVFGKHGSAGVGTAELARACGRPMQPKHTESAPNPPNFPVLALGGVTLQNAQSCLAAGAAGVAGIRLFQENDVWRVVEALRRLRA